MPTSVQSMPSTRCGSSWATHKVETPQGFKEKGSQLPNKWHFPANIALAPASTAPLMRSGPLERQLEEQDQERQQVEQRCQQLRRHVDQGGAPDKRTASCKSPPTSGTRKASCFGAQAWRHCLRIEGTLVPGWSELLSSCPLSAACCVLFNNKPQSLGAGRRPHCTTEGFRVDFAYSQQQSPRSGQLGTHILEPALSPARKPFRACKSMWFVGRFSQSLCRLAIQFAPSANN